jgi:hypothetical protein
MNLISVNAGFLQVCQPQMAGGKNYTCPKGIGELQGTGFDMHTSFMGKQGSAATSWLNTTAPVPPGADITLTFAIWDSGDGVLDSSVLIDNFKFTVMPGTVGTKPIPM